MQNHHKPPRPPPLSVSQPAKPNWKSESSPLRSESPPKNGGAIVTFEKYYSPLTSPNPAINPPTPDNDTDYDNDKFSSPPHHAIQLCQTGTGTGTGTAEPQAQSGVVSERKVKSNNRRAVRFGVVDDISKKEGVIPKINLGIRVVEIALCLISFSVMAADRTQGWAGDSFDRYKEYRFCLSVNILGFLYSAFQAYDGASHLATGKHVISHHLRYQFDFIMDQILAYLLISASSAAASRVDDWQANWGKDEFTEKASASISMAFLAFLGFAMSSLISGYNLCNRDLS